MPVPVAGSRAALEPPAAFERYALDRPRALLCDDDAVSRSLFGEMFAELGFTTVQAASGHEALALFAAQPFDVVCMDVDMPGMDGIETTRRLRALPGSRFVPVLFLTGHDDEDTLEHCLAAGGDDFLAKPGSLRVLRTRISALRRLGVLYERLRRSGESERHNEDLAARVLDNAIAPRNLVHPSLRCVIRPVATCGGDFHLAARAPSGDVHVVLGDFTGHGLAAAIGALPTAEVFHAMVRKGFAPEQVLRSIDEKLATLLPTGLFLAMQYVVVQFDLAAIRVANCAMPPILLLQPDGAVRDVPSNSLALGVDGSVLLPDGFASHPITPGTRVCMTTDGLFETLTLDGKAFGLGGLARAAHLARASGRSFVDTVFEAVQHHSADGAALDDRAAIDLLCDAALVGHADATAQRHQRLLAGGGWQTTLLLQGAQLRTVDPVPLLLDQVGSLVGNQVRRSELFTVLTELFVNALDHGVLELDSTLKCDASGFARYLAERAARLADLQRGWVRFELATYNDDGTPALRIAVTDSGQGFDPAKLARTASIDTPLASGRGHALLRALCTGIDIDRDGTRTTVRYRL